MPDGPIGTRKQRVKKALYWSWTKDLTQEEIGEKLGVSRQKVSEYIREAPTSPEVQNQLDTLEAEVRFVAAEKLKAQLIEAGERAASAEKQVKVWEDEDTGDILVRDVYSEFHDPMEPDDPDATRTQLAKRYPIPAGFEIDVDEQGRFFGRQEVREILDLLTDIVGAKAADRQEIELSGEVETERSMSDADREWLEGRFGGDE